MYRWTGREKPVKVGVQSLVYIYSNQASYRGHCSKIHGADQIPTYFLVVLGEIVASCGVMRHQSDMTLNSGDTCTLRLCNAFSLEAVNGK